MNNLLKKLLKPAFYLSNRLSYASKMLAVSLIYLAAIAMLFIAVYTTLSEDVRMAERQLEGIKVIESMLVVAQLEQQHHGLEMALITDPKNQPLQEAHLASEVAVERATLELSSTLPAELLYGQEWQFIQKTWESIGHNSDTLASDGSFDVHTKIIQEILFFIESVSDTYALPSDKNTNSRYLTSASIKALPSMLEQMGQLRTIGLNVATLHDLSDAQRVRMNEHFSHLRLSMTVLRRSLSKAQLHNSDLANTLDAVSGDIDRTVQDFVELFERRVFRGGFSESPMDFYKLSTALIDHGYQIIFSELLPQSESLYDGYIQHEKKKLYGYVSITLLLILIAHYYLLGIFYSVRGNLKQFVKSAQRFSQGDMDVRLSVNSQDEFRQIADSFNIVAESFKSMLSKQLESERLWHFAIDGSGDGVWDWDIQSHEVKFSKCWKEMLGYTVEDVQDSFQWWSDHVHPDDLSGVLSDSVQPFVEGKTENYSAEFRMRCKNGSYKWILARAMATERQDGKPLRVVGTHTDITERKDLEDFLRKSQQEAYAFAQELDLQKYALDHHAVVATTDVSGHITYANELFCINSGYSRDELLGQDHRILNSGYHPNGFFKEMYRTIASGNVWSGEICNRAKDGHLYWEATTIAPEIGIGGKPTRYIAVRTDISARKKAEEAAKSASLAKSEFLANMSHEIRTPMNGVIGMVDVLQQTSLNSEQQRMLHTIQDSSNSLLVILNDILDFSKIEVGRLDVERIPTLVRETIESTVQLMLATANAKSITLSVFVCTETPRWIASDPTRLRQILLNMLGNAVKFTSGKSAHAGQVALRAECIKLAEGHPGIRFRIIDNGIGMSLEAQAKLFKPFSQADASTSRKFGGTGLGLCISHRLVELMGGAVSIRSIEGEGTEFIIDLPIEEAEPSSKSADEPDLIGVRVMIVSSDAEHSEDLSAYCRSAGTEVSLVTDLATARTQLQQMSPSLPLAPLVILCDVEFAKGGSLDLPDTARVVQLVMRGRSILAARSVPVHANPLFYQDLLCGLAIASGRMTPSDSAVLTDRRKLRRIQAPSVEEAQATNRLILLAEDNETNREVIKEQLSLLGYAAEVAEDGALALAMWRTGRYALLLSDCHMPNMDGFELTAAIRREEIPYSRLPIIAITANALQGESERCILQGMDDYISKPLRLSMLGDILAKWLPLPTVMTEEESAGTEQGGESDNSSTDASEFPVWDSTTLTRMVGDNPSMHQRFLHKFLINAQMQLDAILVAVDKGDAMTSGSVAHALKSTSRTVGAMQFGELCQAMEMAGKAGDIQTCDALLVRLNGAFGDASREIKQILNQEP